MKTDNYDKMMAVLLIAAVASGMVFSGCAQNGNSNSSAENTSSANQSVVSVGESSAESVVSVEQNDIDPSYEDGDAVTVQLNDTTADIKGSGAVMDGGVLKITEAGTYKLSGTLKDGQIRIEANKKDEVKLILNNVSVSCSTGPALYSVKSGKTILVLENGTENSFSDGSSYITESESSESDTNSPDAAVYVQDDLTILGSGKLNVKANAKNGITSKDTLKITDGDITVEAVKHGITGKDNLYISGGSVKVNSGSDGMRSTYSDTDDADKGHIYIENAEMNITSGNDAVQAEKKLIVNSGTINIVTGGGSGENKTAAGQDGFGGFGQNNNKNTSDTESRKGIKGGEAIIVTGGNITIDSYDDAVHSKGSVSVSGGNLTVKSGDDGVHADTSLEIKNGNATVSKSYEGLEAETVTISGGVVDVTSSDDGINCSGGNDSSGFGGMDGNMQFGGHGGKMPGANENALLSISGGTVYVSAQGDGLDSNGALNISGGTVIVNGTTNGGNGIIDHDGSSVFTGGKLIGAGTSDMLEMPSGDSAQYSTAILFDSVQTAGTLVYITDKDGNVLAAMEPEKNYSCVIFSAPELTSQGTYSVYVGGKATGEAVHGYYTTAAVSGGTLYTTFTPDSAVTYVNADGLTTYSGMGGMRGGMRGNMPEMSGMPERPPFGDMPEGGFDPRKGGNGQPENSMETGTV